MFEMVLHSDKWIHCNVSISLYSVEIVCNGPLNIDVGNEVDLEVKDWDFIV